MSTTTLSEKKLFAYLIVDDIELEEGELKKLHDGDDVSQSKMGDIYYNKEDYAKAIDWYRLSAEQDNDHAQYRLGYMYSSAYGVSVDYKLSMEWYLKAHENGNSEATNMVGVMYYHGWHVQQDYKLALEWFRNSANQGNDCAMNNVGRYYENGFGVKKDLQFALEWYEQSAEKGFETAKNNIDRLNKEGHFYDDKIKRFHVLTKERNEQKSKMEDLEKQLKTSEQKRLESENEIKLLKDQFEEFKMLLKNSGEKDEVNLEEDNTDEQSDTDSSTTGEGVKTDTNKDVKTDEEKS